MLVSLSIVIYISIYLDGSPSLACWMLFEKFIVLSFNTYIVSLYGLLHVILFLVQFISNFLVALLD